MEALSLGNPTVTPLHSVPLSRHVEATVVMPLLQAWIITVRMVCCEMCTMQVVRYVLFVMCNFH